MIKDIWVEEWMVASRVEIEPLIRLRCHGCGPFVVNRTFILVAEELQTKKNSLGSNILIELATKVILRVG